MKYCVASAVSPAPTKNEETRAKRPADAGGVAVFAGASVDTNRTERYREKVE